MIEFNGIPGSTPGKIGIVVSKFNEHITSELLKGTLEVLKKHKIADSQLVIAWVPGAFEIPLIAKQLASSKDFEAIICLGAVIRGDTPHFEYVSDQAATGIQQVALEKGIPILFGVLTTDNEEQALQRIGGSHGHKGKEAAIGALEMIDLQKRICGYFRI